MIAEILPALAVVLYHQCVHVPSLKLLLVSWDRNLYCCCTSWSSHRVRCPIRPMSSFRSNVGADAPVLLARGEAYNTSIPIQCAPSRTWTSALFVAVAGCACRTCRACVAMAVQMAGPSMHRKPHPPFPWTVRCGMQPLRLSPCAPVSARETPTRAVTSYNPLIDRLLALRLSLCRDLGSGKALNLSCSVKNQPLGQWPATDCVPVWDVRNKFQESKGVAATVISVQMLHTCTEPTYSRARSTAKESSLARAYNQRH